jgi:hypothetical protein
MPGSFISRWESCICLAWPVTCTCMQFRCICCRTQTQQRCEHKQCKLKGMQAFPHRFTHSLPLLASGARRLCVVVRSDACLPPIIYPPSQNTGPPTVFFQLLQPCGRHTTVGCGEACNYWANMYCWGDLTNMSSKREMPSRHGHQHTGAGSHTGIGRRVRMHDPRLGIRPTSDCMSSGVSGSDP